LDLKNRIFEAKQRVSTHQKSDNSEWKFCTYKLLLGSINFHKILEQSHTLRGQKADLRQVPCPSRRKFRFRFEYFQPGACKSLDK